MNHYSKSTQRLHLFLNFLIVIYSFVIVIHLKVIFRIHIIDVAKLNSLNFQVVWLLLAREDLTRSFRDTNTRESSGQSMMLKDLYFNCLNNLHGSACMSGLTDESSLRFKLVMQKEILVQAVANMGPLCLPLMLQVQYITLKYRCTLQYSDLYLRCTAPPAPRPSPPWSCWAG